MAAKSSRRRHFGSGYAVGYWRDAAKRGTGFTIAMFAFALTWTGALAAVLRHLAFA